MQSTSAITKTIIPLIALCLLIMATVIGYRYFNRPQPTLINSDQGVLFTTGRELKPFSLLSANNQTFDEKNFYNHTTLVFFGFTHCMSFCPNTMKMLSEAYPTLSKQYPNLQVVLVSLDTERDTPQITNNYAKRFDSRFIGISGKQQEVRKLQAQFGVASEKDDNSVPSNYQIQHTASIFLLNPKAQWVGLFKYGMSKDDFIIAFKHAMKNTPS